MEAKEYSAKVSIFDLIEQLRKTDNPVTRWALKQCILDRLKRDDYD